MEYAEIARAFSEIADLLEIAGDNPFRVRAYRSAARTVADMARPLRRMVEEGVDLEEIPTIGEDTAAYIEEMVRTGGLQRLDEVRASIPATLRELTRLDGIGPKRAARLWQEAGVRTLAELGEALEDGRVAGLRGFGEKTVEALRRSLRELEARGDRVSIALADQFVASLLAFMEDHPSVDRIEVAGSWRRRRETVGDLDVVVASSDPASVMRRFTAYPEAKRVDSAGSTRGTIVLRTGLHVDLRIVPLESWGAALQYLTGSKAHTVALRSRAVERGLKINEYGVFAGEERRGGREEGEIYEAVGLVWTPPELREDRGEIEAAAEDALPTLLELDEIRGDLQMHSSWSDGKTSIREMAEACRDMGYAYMAITDHSAAVRVAGGLDAARLEAQWEEIERARAEVEGIHIFRGMEVDILKDGALDLDDEHLDGLDLVVASVHSHMGLSLSAQTARIVKALAHPAVRILAHPTGRLIGRRKPYDVDLEEVFQAALHHGVAVELNANPGGLDLNGVQVMRARQLGVPVVIDTDAHGPEQLRYMRYGVDQARRGWLGRRDVLNTKTLAQMRRWLERRSRPATGPQASR